MVKLRIHKDQQTKKISNLQPIEVDMFLKFLFNRLIDDKENEENIYYLKLVLYHYCTRINNSKIADLYISKLSNIGRINLYDKFKYLIYLLKGRVIWLLKKVFRRMLNLKYRNKE